MKTLLILICTTLAAFAEPSPTVEVYMIRKFDSKDPTSGMPEVIFEIANPTKETFYVSGESITSPIHHLEALRDTKWLRIPSFICGTGHSVYPLRPGTKMLVTVYYPWDEASIRYRFFFWTSPKQDKVLTVTSKAIERKELGDFAGTIGELNSTKKLEESVTDEDMNKGNKGVTDPSDPFAQ
ncbi:MAG: hypothetical protein J0M04_17335 [Verrucomicrobia bacterium]|nr:hypothetical protein [Verrucomicrobiota bacterium]